MVHHSQSHEEGASNDRAKEVCFLAQAGSEVLQWPFSLAGEDQSRSVNAVSSRCRADRAQSSHETLDRYPHKSEKVNNLIIFPRY